MGAAQVGQDIRCRLVLSIRKGDDLTLYTVERLWPDPRVAWLAWRLTKEGGECYDITQDVQGRLHCECQAFKFGHRPCKHCVALHSIGLLPRGSVKE